jgi:hypothetical protein
MDLALVALVAGLSAATFGIVVALDWLSRRGERR